MTAPEAAAALAVRRWMLGHHAFHLQLVAMNTSLDQARTALDARSWTTLERLLRDLRSLYDAATAAMKYAAGFAPSYYTAVIRPSMSEPLLSPAFSGRLNREHQVMLDLFRKLRTAVRPVVATGTVPASTHRAWRELLSAQSRNRRNHMWVCEKFVAGGRSLLDEHFAREVDPDPRTEEESPW